MVELFSFLLDILDILSDFDLLLSTLESIGKEKFAIETSDLLCALEEFAIGMS